MVVTMDVITNYGNWNADKNFLAIFFNTLSINCAAIVNLSLLLLLFLSLLLLLLRDCRRLSIAMTVAWTSTYGAQTRDFSVCTMTSKSCGKVL